MFKLCSNAPRAVFSMPCADPGLSLLRTRERGEDTTPLQSCRAGHHPSTPAGPRAGAAGPQATDTYINLAEDDIDDAANHYQEVKDVPGVSKVALSGRSQRGVNMQGCKSGRRQAGAQGKGYQKVLQ